MAETPQDRINARDAAQRALDAAVLACRDDPSPDNHEANLAAGRVYMEASFAVIADELIEQQQRPATATCVRCRLMVEHHKGYWWTGDDFMCPDGEQRHEPRPAQ